ncbi:hypothetical protein [Vibrio coralliilyticus]|uniref:hypothetical protein n=2 Tax=Vibrio coralliilyticus TaxID=190893 RepID=UPI000BAABB5F|nr:hypothetical protein [Vibrio coralliilyticus]NOH54965.1 hypothetical protein [Vibrio coralliilyticus]NOI31480.1 hypothetical protein [Vibrio coralliilyticus]NOI50900.1 hypothetical protein [Vibrio coralliilyticus]NOI60643.1 hypothetical protein [Vibrio coralliilyticus]PAT65385.1 hypothetical protein CKA27_25025 [Vibrio coralliilyticus]
MKYFNTVKKYSKKAALGAGMLVVSASAFANEHPITAAINSAVAAGKANYEIVVIGIITLTALGFGLGRITSSMK